MQDRFGGADNAVQIQHRGGNPDPVEYVVDRRCVFVQICDEHLNALNQLRNQNQHQQRKKQDHRNERKHGGRRFAVSFLLDPAKQAAAVQLRQRIDQICDHTAEDHGPEIPQECADPGSDARQMRQYDIQYDGDACGDRVIEPWFFLQAFHRTASFIPFRSRLYIRYRLPRKT